MTDTTQAAESAPEVPLDDPTTRLPDAAPAVETEAAESTEPAAEPDIVAEETEGEGEPEQGESKKKPSGSQRLKRRLAMIEAEFQSQAAELEHFRQREAAQQPAQQGRPGIDRPPTEADFPNDWFAFTDAKQAWSVREVFREERMREQQQRQREMQAEQFEEYRANLEEQSDLARQRIPDFDKVVRSAEVRVTPYLERELLASDKPALLQYYLAKNPDKVRDLNRMQGAELVREVARLEARLHLPTPKKTTQASPPLSQPRGGAAAPVDLNSADMAQYVAMRKKQNAGA